MRTSSLCFALAVVAACTVGDQEPPDFSAPGELVVTAGPVPLVDDVPVTGLAGARRAELHFVMVVPEGAAELTFTIAGGSGDADLYVRYGAAPTTSQWDYRPYLDGNDERVAATTRAGSWYVMVRGYRAFDGVSLVGGYVVEEEPPPPPPSDGPDCRVAESWPAAWVAFEDEVLARVNAHRAAGATCGGVAKPAVGPVVMDGALREAARCHSLDMGVNGYFSHTSPDGRSPWDRIAEAGYDASPTGENIAAGYATPEAVVAGWMASTGHCNNVMAGGSNEIGVGFAEVEGSPYGRYWTQAFGRR